MIGRWRLAWTKNVESLNFTDGKAIGGKPCDGSGKSSATAQHSLIQQALVIQS
jgi:hypothetical protein